MDSLQLSMTRRDIFALHRMVLMTFKATNSGVKRCHEITDIYYCLLVKGNRSVGSESRDLDGPGPYFIRI